MSDYWKCESLADTISCTSSCGGPGGSAWWDDVYEAADLTRKDLAPYPAADGALHKVSSVNTVLNQKEDKKRRKDEADVCDASSHLGRTDPGVLSFQYQSKRNSLVSVVEKEIENDSILLALNQKEIKGLLYASHLKILRSKVFCNHGLKHVSSIGKVRAGRQLKDRCHNNCKRCEIPKITDEERGVIFRWFWSLGNHEKQWKFIFDCVTESVPLRKVAVPNQRREKFSSRSYFLPVGGKAKKLCKTMFKNTLCICDSWINSALSHNRISAPPIPDMRGKSRSSSLQNL